MTQDTALARPATRSPALDAAWERLARALAHEVRSPLNAMGIYLELLQTRHATVTSDGRTGLERFTGKVQEQAGRVEELVRQFLAVWAPGREGACDVATTVRGVLRFAHHEGVRRGVTVGSDVAPASFPVDAHAHRLVDALVLLLVTVIDRAGDGGRVSVRLEPEEEGRQARLWLDCDPAAAVQPDALQEVTALLGEAGVVPDVSAGRLVLVLRRRQSP